MVEVCGLPGIGHVTGGAIGTQRAAMRITVAMARNAILRSSFEICQAARARVTSLARDNEMHAG